VKTLLAVALIALLAFGLAACGGSDESSSSPSTAASGASRTTTTAPAEDEGGGNEKQGGDEKGGPSGGGSTGEDHPRSDEASAEFRTPGGDNSIQNYGEEADEGEREAAEAAIVGYLDARARSDWAKSCGYLAAMTREPLEKLAESSSKLKGEGCGAIVGALSGSMPKSALANPVEEGISSVRSQGQRGFALFHGPNGAKFVISLAREDGEWKVASLVPSELP
jgi:hypothetical protein